MIIMVCVCALCMVASQSNRPINENQMSDTHFPLYVTPVARRPNRYIAFSILFLFSFSLIIMLRIDTQSGNHILKYPFSTISAHSPAPNFNACKRKKKKLYIKAPVNQTYKHAFFGNFIYIQNLFLS